MYTMAEYLGLVQERYTLRQELEAIKQLTHEALYNVPKARKLGEREGKEAEKNYRICALERRSIKGRLERVEEKLDGYWMEEEDWKELEDNGAL